jgi:LacI family transcriptional regulator
VSVSVEFLPENDPYTASTLLDSIEVENIDGVAIMAPATPQVRDAVTRLRGRGVSVVTFVSRQANDEADSFIGIDNIAAGRTAARLMGRYTSKSEGAILVICETMQAQNSRERRAGFDEIINADFATLKLLPTLETYGSSKRAQQILQNIADSGQLISGAYITTAAVEHILPFLTPLLDTVDRTVIAHERTPFTEDALRDNTLDVVITQNAGHLVRSAIRTLKASVDNRDVLLSQEKVRIEIVVRDNL